jgi:hypothetical protein
MRPPGCAERAGCADRAGCAVLGGPDLPHGIRPECDGGIEPVPAPIDDGDRTGDRAGVPLPEHREDEQPDRPRANDQDPSVVRVLGHADAVHRDRQRFRERRGFEGKPIGDLYEHAVGHDDPFGVRAVDMDPDEAAAGADVRVAGRA